MVQNSKWEIVTLKLKAQYDLRSERKPVAVMFNYITNQTSNFMLIGIDYNYQKEFMCYRQALYQIIIKSINSKMSKINLGFAASFEKKKLGAKVLPTYAYMQTKDNYNLEVLGAMNASAVKITSKESQLA